MYKSPSRLSEDARKEIAADLNARLLDGLDLHSQIKVAHWNIKARTSRRSILSSRPSR